MTKDQFIIAKPVMEEIEKVEALLKETVSSFRINNDENLLISAWDFNAAEMAAIREGIKDALESRLKRLNKKLEDIK